MTNEKREAIEYLERQIRVCNENAEICDDNNFDEEATHLREESYMLDTVLALIKEQQEEMENKDKQIDLMAELVYKRFKAELLLEYGFENEDQLKQYFAGLVEKE